VTPERPLTELDYCVVDTETTGGRAEYSRITEVAAFHYRDGIIYDKFHTLLNPGGPIPPWITALTGIDDIMVKDAPRFAEIAPKLRKFLSRGVFVAHNAGFDYSFIQSEFQRMGEAWESPRLCTVRVARHLFPELPSRSLGPLCAHLLIEIYDRHRAAGDAEATVYVLKHCLKLLAKNFGVNTWGALETWLAHGPLRLPEGLTIADIEALPEVAGSFVLKDAAGEAILKGKSTNIRKRVRSFFRAANRSKKALLYRELVRSIETLAARSAAISSAVE
jgi:DNA polymerase-3 subunit epsilon